MRALLGRALLEVGLTFVTLFVLGRLENARRSISQAESERQVEWGACPTQARGGPGRGVLRCVRVCVRAHARAHKR